MAGDGIEFKKQTVAKAIETAKKEGKHVFIDVYASWCGPCKMLSSSTFKDEELGKFFNENFISLKLDGETNEGMAYMGKFDLDSYPSLLFLSDEGELLKKIEGFVDAGYLLSKAKTVADPSLSPVFGLQKKYDSGNREKETLIDLFKAKWDEDHDVEELAIEIVQLFPELNLEEENQMLIFAYAVNKEDHPLMVDFKKKIKVYSAQHNEICRQKVSMILSEYLNDALLNGNMTEMKKKVSANYYLIEAAFDKDAISEKELIEAFEEAIKERVGN